MIDFSPEQDQERVGSEKEKARGVKQCNSGNSRQRFEVFVEEKDSCSQ